MSRNPVLPLILMVVLSLGAGCQSFGGAKSLTPKESRRGSSTQNRNDPWVSEFGDYARGEHKTEPVNDPLGLRNMFTSEQARDIERNLGVGE